MHDGGMRESDIGNIEDRLVNLWSDSVVGAQRLVATI